MDSVSHVGAVLCETCWPSYWIVCTSSCSTIRVSLYAWYRLFLLGPAPLRHRHDVPTRFKGNVNLHTPLISLVALTLLRPPSLTCAIRLPTHCIDTLISPPHVAANPGPSSNTSPILLCRHRTCPSCGPILSRMKRAQCASHPSGSGRQSRRKDVRASEPGCGAVRAYSIQPGGISAWASLAQGRRAG